MKSVINACDESDSYIDSIAVESDSVDLRDINETESSDSVKLD